MKKLFTALTAAVMALVAICPAGAAQQTTASGPAFGGNAPTILDQNFQRADQNFTELYGRSATTLPLKATASLGVVAGGTWVPDNFFVSPNGTANPILNEASVSVHKAYDTLTSPSVGVAGFYVAGGSAETSFTGTNTAQVALEYPTGTCTLLPQNGSTAAFTVPNGGIAYTDASGWSLPTPVPAGAVFKIRLYWLGTVGIPFKTGVPINPDNGTKLTYGTTPSPAANSTLPTNGLASGPCPASVDTNGSGPGTRSAGVSAGFVMAPAIILHNTKVQSVGVVGDSTSAGYKGSMLGSSLDYGLVCRAVGMWGPCLNLGVSGDTLTSFMTAGRSTNRLAMLSYVNQIVGLDSINDLSNGALQTAASQFALWGTFKALFPGIPVHLTTTPPKSSSSDTWATVANQTANTQCLAQVPAYNALVRTASAANGFASPFDVGGLFSAGVDTCKWALGPYGTPVNPTDDGVHPLAAMYDRPAEAGIFAPSRF